MFWNTRDTCLSVIRQKSILLALMPVAIGERESAVSRRQLVAAAEIHLDKCLKSTCKAAAANGWSKIIARAFQSCSECFVRTVSQSSSFTRIRRAAILLVIVILKLGQAFTQRQPILGSVAAERHKVGPDVVDLQITFLA
jgi:hypothetical protein